MVSPSRERRTNSFKRQVDKKAQRPTILIVCEGSKTEPNYLLGLKVKLRLSSARIEIIHPGKTDPGNIVEFAEEKRRSGDYDKVFCVFDRDTHENFEETVSSSRNVNSREKLKIITSWPCFEFWVLLHYEYTARPFTNVGGKSPCEMVIRSIHRHIPSYQKADKKLFELLENKIEIAIRNAERLVQENASAGVRNPSTSMHELIIYMKSLQK